MKKLYFAGVVLCLFCFLSLTGQEADQKQKTDPMEKLSIVEQTQPAPERVKVGFDSITGKDAVTYLSFLSSDLLQGRDTASLGYDIAAEYVASMFTLWGIKPAGDFTRPVMRSPFGSGSPPQKAKRSYFQSVALRETLENKGWIEVAWQKDGQKKTKTFYSDNDYSFKHIRHPIIYRPCDICRIWNPRGIFEGR